jgi:CRISPR-associated protein Csc1
MAVEIYRADLTLMEHTFFASREVGIYYETEPLIGNYALAYALGLCASPYYWDGPPRYKQDLGPLNSKGLYVTPGTFVQESVRYALSQFNAQTDSYFFRFDQNAIGTNPVKKARAANFPQSGKIRMLGQGSRASFFLLNEQANEQGGTLRLPTYIRLGKFNSKARLIWEKLTLRSMESVERENERLDFLINAADLPTQIVSRLRSFSMYNLSPAPLLSHCHLSGQFWQCGTHTSADVYIPVGMRFGVDALV